MDGPQKKNFFCGFPNPTLGHAGEWTGVEPCLHSFEWTRNACCMSKKSWHTLYRKLLKKKDQDFLDKNFEIREEFFLTLLSNNQFFFSSQVLSLDICSFLPLTKTDKRYWILVWPDIFGYIFIYIPSLLFDFFESSDLERIWGIESIFLYIWQKNSCFSILLVINAKRSYKQKKGKNVPSN